jgi:hypothetical protein
MLKDNSLGGQLDLKFTDLPPGRKLRIKLEVDTNPPVGWLCGRGARFAKQLCPEVARAVVPAVHEGT